MTGRAANRQLLETGARLWNGVQFLFTSPELVEQCVAVALAVQVRELQTRLNLADLFFKCAGLFIRIRWFERVTANDVSGGSSSGSLQDLESSGLVLQVLGRKNKVADVNGAHRGNERGLGERAGDVGQHRFCRIGGLFQQLIGLSESASFRHQFSQQCQMLWQVVFVLNLPHRGHRQIGSLLGFLKIAVVSVDLGQFEHAPSERVVKAAFDAEVPGGFQVRNRQRQVVFCG